MNPTRDIVGAFFEEARDDVNAILDAASCGGDNAVGHRLFGTLEVFAAEATARVSGDGRIALLTLASDDFERYLAALFAVDGDGNMGRRLLGHLPDDKGDDLATYLTAGDALWAAASTRPEVLDELAAVLTPPEGGDPVSEHKTARAAAHDLAYRVTRDANILYPDADVSVLVAATNAVEVIMGTDVLRIRPSRWEPGDPGPFRGWAWTEFRVEGDGVQEPPSLVATAAGRVNDPQVEAALARVTTFMAWTDHESRA